MEYGQIYGIKVITEKAERTSINLLMQDANAADSGFYTCVPNNAPASKIKVHILTGERESQNKGRHLYTLFLCLNLRTPQEILECSLD